MEKQRNAFCALVCTLFTGNCAHEAEQPMERHRVSIVEDENIRISPEPQLEEEFEEPLGRVTIVLKNLHGKYVEVYGEFEILRRSDGLTVEFVIDQHTEEYYLKLPIGEYILSPRTRGKDDLSRITPECITYEGDQSYDTDCGWRGTDPEIIVVEEHGIATVTPLVWIATEEVKRDPCRYDLGQRYFGLECLELCDTDPLTKEDHGRCTTAYDHCVPGEDGYSVCRERPYRTRL